MRHIVIHLVCEENDDTITNVVKSYQIMSNINGVRTGNYINISRSKEIHPNRDYDTILAEFKKIEF